MKICDITMFYTAQSGGVKTYLHHKADVLAGRPGCRHMMIVPGPGNGVTHCGKTRIHTVRGPRAPAHHPYRFLLNPWRVRKILREESPDIIELGSAYFLPWVLAMAMPRQRPILAGFYHDDFPSTYVSGYGRVAGEPAARAAEALAWAYARRVYRRCDLVLAASKHIADKLVHHGIGPVHHIPLGVNPGLFRPDRRSPALRRRLGGTDHRRLLLYVGRLSCEKGIAYLLEGFQQLSPDRFGLVVAGDGPERPVVEAFSRSHPNAEYVGHCGEPSQLAALYASCDLFVAPGRHESFGLAVLEAFASGLPVVGVRSGGVAELIEQGVGATADPDDVSDLAARIRQVCAEDLRAAGLHARARIEHRYSWSNTFNAMADIYQEQMDARSDVTCANN